MPPHRNFLGRAEGRPAKVASPRIHPVRGMMLLSHALFASVTCPDTKSLPLPSSPLTNTCAGGAAIFTPANLNGDADVLTIYNGDQM